MECRHLESRACFIDIYDAYIHSNGSVILIDVSPFHEDHSEPLMWTWDEIHELARQTGELSSSSSSSSSAGSASVLPPIRIIEQDTHIMPNLKKMATSVPFDLVQPEEGDEADRQPSEDSVDGMDPNNLDALVEKLKRITDAAEKLNREPNGKRL